MFWKKLLAMMQIVAEEEARARGESIEIVKTQMTVCALLVLLVAITALWLLLGGRFS